MSNKYDLFRASLSVPMFENLNQSLFNLLKTPEYQNYTDIVFSTLGKEFEKYFGKDMIFKYRYKSQNSFTRNILKDSSIKNDKTTKYVSNFNPYIHYDIIGMKIVIKHIPEDFKISPSFIKTCEEKEKRYQKKLFDLQKQCYSKNHDLENDQEKNSITHKKILHLERYLLYLNDCCNFNQILERRNTLANNYYILQKTINNHSQNNNFDLNELKLEFETTEFALKNLNSLLNTIAGEYAIEEIFEKSENLKKLGVHLNPNRQKFFSEEKGYTSMHFSIESSKLNHWISELQDLSSSIDYLSVKSHDALPGKKRHLMNLPKNINKQLSKKYIKSFKNISPSYTIYKFNGYIERYNMRKNLHHYYNTLLKNNPEYTKKLHSIIDNKENEPFLPVLQPQLKKILENDISR